MAPEHELDQEIDHSQCPAEAHDRSLPEGDEQAHADDGLLACNDCGRPAYYCTRDENYHHVDPEAVCFLIQS